MTLPRHYSLINILTFSIVSIAIVGFAILYSVWAFDRFRKFEQETVELRESYILEQERLIQHELSALIDYMEFNRSQIEERVKEVLRGRVYNAWDIADNIYNKYKGQLPEEEIKSLVREAIRPITFNNGRGYYFATGLDGIEQLFADHPEMEGRDFINVKDARRVPIIQEMIALVEKDGEGFYEYFWSRPNRDNTDYRKFSFLKEFTPFSWFFGAGEYLDDIEDDVKQEILLRTDQLRFGKNGYVFIFDSNGIVLSHPNKQLVSTDVDGLTQEMLNVDLKDGFGTYRYMWPRNDGHGDSEKYSGILRFPEWGWFLAAGFHLDEVDKQIAQKQAEVKRQIISGSINVALVVMAMIFVMLVVSRFVSQKIRRNIDLFSKFFQKSAVESSRLAPESVVFSEFDIIARSVNEMIEERNRVGKEKHDLQKRLQQSEKLEAIGTLAGGIAHDFNNLLTSITGNVSLLSIKIGKDDPRHRHIDSLVEASSRAKELVQQILAFGRKSHSDKEPIDLNEIVSASISLLRASIPTTVVLEKDLQLSECVVRADATQVQQIVLNLCTNAYQSLPEKKGEVLVTLTSCDASSMSSLAPKNIRGKIVAHLAVKDNGSGIAPDALTQIFDPFFSTKEVGEGTGLGLSVIHTIVERHGGIVDVESVVGKGTTFHVYLPISSGAVRQEVQSDNVIVRGVGNILLVDDDALVLETNSDILEELGYSVYREIDPVRALSFLKESKIKIDMLITDQTMPGLSGLELIELVRVFDKGMPIMLFTGYSERVNKAVAFEKGCDEFFLKPVNIVELSHSIRVLLGRES